MAAGRCVASASALADPGDGATFSVDYDRPASRVLLFWRRADSPYALPARLTFAGGVSVGPFWADSAADLECLLVEAIELQAARLAALAEEADAQARSVAVALGLSVLAPEVR